MSYYCSMHSPLLLHFLSDLFIIQLCNAFCYTSLFSRSLVIGILISADYKLSLWAVDEVCRLFLERFHLCHSSSDTQGWLSEYPDVKNYKWRLNPVWHRMLYSCTHMATVGVKGLSNIFVCLYHVCYLYIDLIQWWWSSLEVFKSAASPITNHSHSISNYQYNVARVCWQVKVSFFGSPVLSDFHLL